MLFESVRCQQVSLNNQAFVTKEGLIMGRHIGSLGNVKWGFRYSDSRQHL
jgi:hypothetical protein